MKYFKVKYTIYFSIIFMILLNVDDFSGLENRTVRFLTYFPWLSFIWEPRNIHSDVQNVFFVIRQPNESRPTGPTTVK